MNYPVWELPFLGGGTLIAIISIIHVYIAHLAVGAGFFLWYMDRLGLRENNPEIHLYVKKHTFFFLLVSMVLGGVTGVGIWFVISLVHPSATSILIHTFVFFWAIEWVFFLGEIVALLLYHYMFDKLGERRIILALLYGVFAWLSLFMIDGIIGFMLTPGRWLSTGSIASAFFNPTFLPALFFRTVMALAIAALFGHVTAVFMAGGKTREHVLMVLRRWLLVPLASIIPCSVWYYFAIPSDVRMTMMDLNPQTIPFLKLFIAGTVVLFSVGLILARRRDVVVQKGLAFFLLFIGLLWIGGFEYVREIARKPYVIQGYMYSSSILARDTARFDSERFLPHAKWTSIHQVTSENTIDAGRELFRLQCLSCHTIGGVRNNIIPRTENLTLEGLQAQLTGQGKMLQYMPPFTGTEDEKKALALYIYRELNHHGEKVQGTDILRSYNKNLPELQSSEYILFAWSDRGMNEITGSPLFIMNSPDITIKCILLKKGDTPVRVKSGVQISYGAAGSGKSLSGDLKFDDANGVFCSQGIPLSASNETGFNPYPVFTIQAKDTTTGRILGKTGVAVPVTTETGCGNCHGSGEESNVKGIPISAADAILKVHDRTNRTKLHSAAENGRIIQCGNCHDGKRKGMSLSSSIHGRHASYMNDDASSCMTCHPAGGDSKTSYFRGLHNAAGLSCVECHGSMRLHSLSLLAGEKFKAARRNEKVLRRADDGEIKPRIPREGTPDCLACHVNYGQPSSADAFNNWTSVENEWKVRIDGIGLPCIMCHGAAHALYPCTGSDAGIYNLQPMGYTGKPYPLGSDRNCTLCHTRGKNESSHHDNMIRSYRNR